MQAPHGCITLHPEQIATIAVREKMKALDYFTTRPSLKNNQAKHVRGVCF